MIKKAVSNIDIIRCRFIVLFSIGSFLEAVIVIADVVFSENLIGLAKNL